MLSLPPFEGRAFGALEGTFGLAGRGQFNQIVWRVDVWGNHTEMEAELLSLHEWSHNELNNVSSYGGLLTAFAHLAQHARTGRDRYQQILFELVERSRRAHEVYATWYSTNLFLLRAELSALTASYPPEYREYFSEGERLVAGLTQPFARQQAFLCALRMCFSNTRLERVGADLETFSPSIVPNDEYPSRILERLARIIPPEFFVEQLGAFLRAWGGTEVGGIIARACAAPRGEELAGTPAEKADPATMELHRWYHERLAGLFQSHGIECVPYEGHLKFFAQLLPRVSALCSSSVTHPLVSSAQPHDNEANLLLHMENEVLFVRSAPLPCTVEPIAKVPRERWARAVTGDPAHLFFCVRFASQLLAQHQFPEDQAELLRGMPGPLVVLRRRAWSESSGWQCEMLLFQSPGELAAFREETRDVPAYSSISMSALGDSDWYDAWLDPAMASITGSILFDRSLFHTLKDGWPQHVGFRYAKAIVEADGTQYVCFLILAASKDGTYALYLSPCSGMLARAAEAFIRHRLATELFVQDEEFFGRELGWLIRPVVGHLLAEERFFSFNAVAFA